MSYSGELPSDDIPDLPRDEQFGADYYIETPADLDSDAITAEESEVRDVEDALPDIPLQLHEDIIIITDFHKVVDLGPVLDIERDSELLEPQTYERVDLSGDDLEAQNVLKRYMDEAIQDIPAYTYDDGFGPASPDLSSELQEAIDRAAGEETEAAPDDPTREFMDFRQPFDGMQEAIPVVDQKAAAALLSSYLSERSAHPTAGFGIAKSFPYGNERVWVTADDGRLIEQVIGRLDLEGPRVQGHLSIKQHLGKSEFGEGAAYQIWSDGAVRRIDSHAMTLEQRLALAAQLDEIKTPENFAQMSESEKLQDTLRVLHILDNHLANINLADKLGLNNQPVGTQEVARAIRFAENIRKGVYDTGSAT